MHLTRDQVREIDRRAVHEYAIPGIVLMENAALAALDVARQMLVEPAGKPVLVLCGGGNNGGDGFAIARHLSIARAQVTLGIMSDPELSRDEALANWRIIKAMKLSCQSATPDLVARHRWSLIVDALFGTGLSRPPRDPFPAIADTVNASKTPVLAIDVPSGLDCDTGKPLGACIRATRTITFVAPKTGFANPDAAQYLGELSVGNIGCPAELIDAIAGH